MVNLTRIYTRTGDDGTTNLGDMSRTGKNDPRLKAYADVDEANSSIGLVVTAPGIRDDLAKLLVDIQNDLFDVGADLCTPVIDNPPHEPLRVTTDYINRLEKACDSYNEELEPLRSFILPGGTEVAARLHVARTITRRAERSTWAAIDMYHGGVNQLAATYLNRLSDLLFILARVANKELGDVLWEPGRNQK
ncbi:MAG: cob(I)yrinic acid a,c-diamide adenosyltransferase [Actinobacteria bacterium]|nr:cob(I)yrinic acid a,c-diamide adenosyltransferase [Actinomycetota bacterium]NBY15691.1 cob(I)yrinic acid a,c-diamide adenosyltransferase [Actinomycetota bacterium]